MPADFIAFYKTQRLCVAAQTSERRGDVKWLYNFLCPWLKSTNVVFGVSVFESWEHDVGGIHMKGSEPTSRVEKQQIRRGRRFF